jgi:hypothetical protein
MPQVRSRLMNEPVAPVEAGIAPVKVGAPISVLLYSLGMDDMNFSLA